MDAASMPVRDPDSQAVVFTQHFTSGPATTLARQVHTFAFLNSDVIISSPRERETIGNDVEHVETAPHFTRPRPAVFLYILKVKKIFSRFFGKTL